MFYLVRLLGILLPLAYAGAVGTYAVEFFDPGGLGTRAARLARRVMNATLLVHAAYLALLTVYERHLPLSSPPELMTFIAFAVALVYVLVERRTGVERTGMFLVSLPLLLQVVASTLLDLGSAFPAILESPLFAIHTIAGVIGYAAFGVSAIYGVLYLVMHRALKRARFGFWFDRLPPLEVLARMSLGAAKVGVAFLAVTILIGTAWAIQVAPGFARDPKFLLTLGVWAGYLFALLLHRRFHWSERRTIGGFLVGFVLLVAAALATRLVFETFHVFA